MLRRRFQTQYWLSRTSISIRAHYFSRIPCVFSPPTFLLICLLLNRSIAQNVELVEGLQRRAGLLKHRVGGPLVNLLVSLCASVRQAGHQEECASLFPRKRILHEDSNFSMALAIYRALTCLPYLGMSI